MNENKSVLSNNLNGWTIIDSNSPLERIMRDALILSKLNYKEQVSIYERHNSSPRFIIDFVICGTNSKVAIEGDGHSYHYNSMKKVYYDKLRDIWLMRHGYPIVLHFVTDQIKNNVYSCIDEIRNTLKNLDLVNESNSNDQNPKKSPRSNKTAYSRPKSTNLNRNREKKSLVR